MPDITMCQDHQCQKRNECYRFLAIPTPLWQSYFTQTPRLVTDEIEECRYFEQVNHGT